MKETVENHLRRNEVNDPESRRPMRNRLVGVFMFAEGSFRVLGTCGLTGLSAWYVYEAVASMSTNMVRSSIFLGLAMGNEIAIIKTLIPNLPRRRG